MKTVFILLVNIAAVLSATRTTSEEIILKDSDLCVARENYGSNTICLLGRKKTYKKAVTMCEALNMTIMSADDGETDHSLLKLLNHHLAAESEIWVKNLNNNQDCTAKRLVESGLSSVTISCDQKLWTYCVKKCKNCENPTIVSEKEKCSKFEDIFIDTLSSKTICHIPSAYTFTESITACEKVGMSLLTFENEVILQGFLKYAEKYFGLGGTLWLDGMIKPNRQWFTHKEAKVLRNIKPKSWPLSLKYGETCLIYQFIPPERLFQAQKCDMKFFPSCGLTNHDLAQWPGELI